MLERKVEGVAVMTFGSKNAARSDGQRKCRWFSSDVGPTRPGISLLKWTTTTAFRQGVSSIWPYWGPELAFISGLQGLHSAQSRQIAFSGFIEGVRDYTGTLRDR